MTCRRYGGMSGLKRAYASVAPATTTLLRVAADMTPPTMATALAPSPNRMTDPFEGQAPCQRRHPRSGDHIVRPMRQNPLTFFGRLNMAPVRHQQKQQVIPELNTAGLAGDQPAELCLFIGQVHLILGLPSHKIT